MAFDSYTSRKECPYIHPHLGRNGLGFFHIQEGVASVSSIFFHICRSGLRIFSYSSTTRKEYFSPSGKVDMVHVN